MIDPLTGLRRAPLWQLVTRFDRARLTPVIAARNTFGVLVALGAGVAAGSTLSGVAAASGALLASYSDTDEPYRRRARRMLVASVAMSVAIVIGGLTGAHPVLAVAGASAAAFAAGMAIAFGPVLADVSVISLVMLITYSAQPLTAAAALAAGAIALAGALLQTALSLALWPVRRDDPERRALGALYLEIARMATEPVAAVASPPASGAITRVQQMLRGASAENPRTERHRSLLIQAERMRLAVLTLRRLHRRLDEHGGPDRSESLRAFLDGVRLVTGAVAEALFTGTVPPWLGERLADLQQLADRWRAAQDALPPGAAAIAADIRPQMDALNGQLRAAAHLASGAPDAAPAPATASAAAARPAPRRRSPIGIAATLQANLSLRSPTFRHALRLMTCVAAGEILAHVIEWRRAYWIPMTIVLVLKPDFAATFSRGVLRVAGTLVGLLLATLLFHVMPAGAAVEAGLLGVFVFVLRWAGPANYGVFTVAVSAVIVLLIALTGVAPAETILARGLDTSVGGALALAAYALWPTWERHRVADVVADMLRAYCDYFHGVVTARSAAGALPESELDHLRLAARLSRTNVEASLERLRAEPGTPAGRIELLQRVMASSHRFAHAAMALEAAPLAAQGDGEAFEHFAADVEETLTALATALHHDRAPSPADLPDLREAVHAVVAGRAEAGGATAASVTLSDSSEPSGLVHAEVDRIANSLNTLVEQLVAWRPPPRGSTDPADS